MSEQVLTTYEITKDHLSEISSTERVSEGENPSITNRQADIDGRRRIVDITKSREGTFVQVSDNPIDSMGRTNPFLTRPVAQLGVRHNTDGSTGFHATVHTGTGEYHAIGSDDKSGVRVEREGYGVELNNPRAKELVVSLAAKAVKKAQKDIAEHKKR